MESKETVQKEETSEMEVVRSTGVPGLFLVKNFITEQEEKELIEIIEAGPWKSNRSGRRRIQMFGPWHDEKYKVKKNGPVTPLPDYAKGLSEKIKEVGKQHFPQFNLSATHLGEDRHTEIFVNEYIAGSDFLQFHMDHRSTYAEVISGVSLLSDCYISYKKGKQEVSILVPRRSLYFMTGPSRFDWQHGMHVGSVQEERRVSLTFRIVQYK